MSFDKASGAPSNFDMITSDRTHGDPKRDTAFATSLDDLSSKENGNLALLAATEEAQPQQTDTHHGEGGRFGNGGAADSE